MTKTEMLNKISLLREVLEDSVLTSADLVAIRNEIGDLQDRIALLDFQEVEDIDFGHHSEWEWKKITFFLQFQKKFLIVIIC